MDTHHSPTQSPRRGDAAPPQGGAFRTALVCLLLLTACAKAEPPANFEVCVLEGTPYERGFQHGQRYAGKIRSLYTRLLENSLLPYLNREQKDVAAFLNEYRKPLYADGQFSYQLLLQSGEHLLAELEETHPEYVEEMEGIAAGSGVPFEKILILNTFVDTMLAFRSVTLYVRMMQAPFLAEVEVLADVDADGIDNDGDGATDDGRDGVAKDYRAGEGWVETYGPRDHATAVELPADARFRFVLEDPPALTSLGEGEEQDLKEGERQGVDPDSVRIWLDDTVWVGGRDDCIETRVPDGADHRLEVIFTPPGGLPPASTFALTVQAGNLSRITDPPPVHARFMRDERLTFTTSGVGLAPPDVPNVGADDGRTQPPSLAFGVRGSATSNNRILLGHHFALLDAGVSHKHAVLFIHRPEHGHPHAVLGWAGLVWGFSGMNADGLSLAITTSDTLNNPLVGSVLDDVTDARLLAQGTPIGIATRLLLTQERFVPDARERLREMETTFGWNLLLGDRRRDLAAVELDADIFAETDRGYQSYDCDLEKATNLDSHARPYGSVGPDDLRIASHYRKKLADIDSAILIFSARPQRYWSSFYFRSVRAHALLGEEIGARYGEIGVGEVMSILRTPALVDQRDSMAAVVFDPERRMLYVAMGQVPATDGLFRPFDLATEGPR